MIKDLGKLASTTMKNSKWLTIGLLAAALAAKPVPVSAQPNFPIYGKDCPQRVEEIAAKLDNGNVNKIKVCIPVIGQFEICEGRRLWEYTLEDYYLVHEGNCEGDAVGALYSVRK